MSDRRKFSACTKALLAHFAASGLSQDHIRRMGVHEVAAGGDPAVHMPVAAVRIPYFDLDGAQTGFYRLRALAELRDREGKLLRYKQPKASGNHLYLPPLLGRTTWREIAEDASRSLLITEGEKKAACGCANGFPTIGLGGVWNWRSTGHAIPELDLFLWGQRTVYLVFDSPDIRTNRNVAIALELLSAELRWRGAAVRIVELPCEQQAKVGLDDFVVSQGKDALAVVLNRSEEYLDATSRLNEQLASVWVGASSLVLRETRGRDGSWDVGFGKDADVRPWFAGDFVEHRDATGAAKRVNVFDHWRNDPRRRKYTRVVFEPGGCNPDEYNLWRGFSVVPASGDCSLYLAHVRDNICNGDEVLYAYVVAWMAHLVQKPGELPGTALVLRGRQGTGKGVFAHTLGALLRAHYLHLSSQRHLLGNFNAHTKDKLLMFADEAIWGGDKQAEGALKALVTEPTRIVEHKGRDALVINNYSRLILASNHEWVVPAGMEERRFAVLDVGAQRMQDTEYFAAIRSQMDAAGLAALLAFLLEVDLSGVNLRKIPKTQGLLETKLMTLPPPIRFWYECLWAGTNGGVKDAWGCEVPCKVLHSRYLEYAQETGHSRRAAESELGRELKRLVPMLRDVRRRRPPSNTQERCWIFPPLEQCRQRFSEALGQPVDWPQDTVARKLTTRAKY